MGIQNNLSPVQGVSPNGHESREGPRFRVLLNAELVSMADEQPVRVRDISTGGAMIEGQRPIGTAKDALLRRGNIEIFGSIVWASGNEAGFAFDAALTESEMMAFVHEQARRASFVPEPFRSHVGAVTPGIKDWAVVEAFRNPIGRGIFGR